MNHDETTNNTTTDLTTTDGRDPATGRFLPNNPGGPGNPLAHRVNRIRSAFVEVAELPVHELAELVKSARLAKADTPVDRESLPDDIPSIKVMAAAVMLKAIVKGCPLSARLISEYSAGRPTTPVSLESAGAPAVQFNIAQLTEIANADG